MHFKKLEVFGFKSFADKTVLNFEPGITAIVGPNGCGKSNVFDAIRWVLGEQSVKELRGSSMEDVIFNGTDKKTALGFAEVTLTFSNECRTLPVEHNEITVARRLYRSGESEYLLNKTTCRLKDIQELFMGTGIGAEAYSLVQQGKVDLVVSAKPEDRRIILDEASGITKYKAKKREALNKLKDTENNLLRINDIITEVKRQIGSIERQANKARRYKDEFEKLKNLELHQAKYQIQSFSQNRERISSRLEELNGQENKFLQELEENNQLLESQNQLLDDLEQKINEVNADEIKIEGQININVEQIGFNRERIEGIVSSSARMAEKKEQLIRKCRQQQSKIEELKMEVNGLNAVIKQKNENLAEKQRGLGVISQAVKEAKRSIHQYEETILENTSKQVSVKNNLTEIMKEVQGCLARKRRLELENTKILSEREEVEERFRQTEANTASVTQRIEAMRSEHTDKMQVFTHIKSQISSTHQLIQELEKKKVLLNSQKEFIEKLQVQYQDIPDPVVEGRLITQKPPSDHHTGIIGKVKEVQYLDSEKCKLFKNGFYKDLDSDQLYEVVCEAKFIELDPQSFEYKIDEVGQEIIEKTEQKNTLIHQIEEQERILQESSKNMHDQEKALSILQSQKNDIQEEMDKLGDELGMVSTEVIEVKQTLGDCKKKEEEMSYHLDSINQDLESCHGNIKERQTFISLKLQEKEEATVSIAQLETEVESDQEKQNRLQEDLTMFEQTLDAELEEMKKLDDEQRQNSGQKEQFENEIAELEGKIEALKNQKNSFKGILANFDREKVEVTQRLNGFRANLESLQEELEKVRQEKHQQEMKTQEIGFSERGIFDRMEQAYRLNVNEIGELEPCQFQVNSPEFEKELIRLKKRCDSFGSVNLVAIEEFEELKERFEFLTKQQSDLLEAKDSLHKTITQINRKTKQMFMDTFTKVSEEFRIYFRMLFGGGEANLVLIDPDNALESGIDIIARPPGKKLQNISLLSGGEKTLTAIALIFGVFKVNPSPFCVLDEIDAALDESNVGRFSYLLKDFAKIAQFIVITHNKRTMTAADVLYGITMQQTGISSVVSVKLTEEGETMEEEVAAGV